MNITLFVSLSPLIEPDFSFLEIWRSIIGTGKRGYEVQSSKAANSCKAPYMEVYTCTIEYFLL